ncbi:MAG: D-glycero-beta-D-manno-heptose 1,7-bisphosphate 7-phosphatase [Selenomonadaceae bacterium]|nr:D-glycero-beta-D-manno-heptose 1,7-bisphosphate 7-phosphatase [Selenomonadaceae bacterium]MBQ7631046.1 D-glycero-beta-D-manno-heptose 1,7-bisphosphate 7-phosphatase [Selenomonadaceae bacterium]
MNKAIFFDRDGVLNVDVIDLHELEKFQWIDGAVDAIKLCNERGFLVVVITNQSGIARGIFTEDDVKKIHSNMQAELEKVGAHIDAFYYCPHHPNGTVEPYAKVCDCRKPKPGLILSACKDLDIDPEKSVMIGDKMRDIESGKNAGVKGAILFEGGNLYDAIKNFLDK